MINEDEIVRNYYHIFDSVVFNLNSRRDPQYLDRKLRSESLQDRKIIHRGYIRYVLSYYEKWDPYQAVKYFNGSIAKKYCLETSINVGTPLPPEIRDKYRYQYAVARAFNIYNEEMGILLCYKEILEKRRRGENIRFPRYFFGGNSDGYDRVKGIKRANLCLRYAVYDAINASDGLLKDIVHDKEYWEKPVYNYFKVKGRSFLETYCLKTARCIKRSRSDSTITIYPLQYLIEAFPEKYSEEEKMEALKISFEKGKRAIRNREKK